MLPPNETFNPYSVTPAPDIPPDVPVFRFIMVPLFFVALVLLCRGGLIAWECHGNLSASMDSLLSYWGAAMFFKSMTFGVTGLFGGLYIFLRKPIGWWFAMMHCFWYLAWNVVVAFAGPTYHWKHPMIYPKDAIYSGIRQSLLIGCIGIAFLALTPTMNFLHVSPEGRSRKIIGIMVISVSIAFLTNWWAGLR